LQDVPVTALKGVGPKTAELLGKLGIRTAGDLVRHYPYRFDRFPGVIPAGDIREEGIFAVLAAPAAPLTVLKRGRFQAVRGTLSDGTGDLKAVWYNMPYLKKALREGTYRVFVGKTVLKGRGYEMEQPRIFSEEEYLSMAGRPVPVYALTEGISNRTMAKLIRQALETAPEITDWLPKEIRNAHSLMELDQAARAIHAPDDMEVFAAARRRLVFDEFYGFLSRVREIRKRNDDLSSPCVMQTEEAQKEIRELLPFRLTTAQEKAAQDIAADLSSGKIMNRLIQGDVGSGKTAVALTAVYTAYRNGYQSAMMAPTEVLAKQHFSTISSFFRNVPDPPKLLLLTGSMKASEKKAAREMIRDHEADIIIGTHALIQEDVEYAALALVVSDEQHRSGVSQRGALAEKGDHPHRLVMSATPIPRTLAVILYGDLDISTIETKPAGRLPVKNAVIRKQDRPKAFLHIKKEIEAGHQAYIICPLVEESELCDEENVTDYGAKVKEMFRGTASAEILHGRMKEAEKQAVMERFVSGETDILVSTTVVEVGVDVPNATVMMIENAEQFGLASLHQLRGRVGRGEAQSYCIFVQGKKSETANERLQVLKKSNDGFEIAAADLKMRGPGDLFGLNQSGELTFALGDIYNDYLVLQTARKVLESGLVSSCGYTSPAEVIL
jgi:ATP-dependent DNA helicase RecG